MDIIQALILSLVEGITEFLPISSTGHLVLASHIMHIAQTEFVKSFEIIIQLGAISAIVFLYRKTLLTNFDVWKKIVVAFLPTGILGLVFYKFIKTYLIGNISVTLWALALGGIVLIIMEKLYKERQHHIGDIGKITYKQALCIGLFQSLAMIPGVSRAGATIIGGLFLGAKRKTAVEFSFLLAIPTMASATALDLIESNFSFSSYEYVLLMIGLVASAVVAFITVKFFLRFVERYSFIPFGIYRIILAIVYFAILEK